MHVMSSVLANLYTSSIHLCNLAAVAAIATVDTRQHKSRLIYRRVVQRPALAVI
jgi:hypothetical protein